MARISKGSALKPKLKSKAVKSAAEIEVKGATTSQEITLVEEPAQESSAVTAKASADKKVSQKLLETIERRKKAQGAAGKNNSTFGRPAGRRGRRPKAAVEYVPGNQEEEAYVLESDYEGLEYDTGIRVKEGGDDKGFAMERFDDYDEELNFDW